MEITDTSKDKWDDPPQLVDQIKTAIENSNTALHVTHIDTDPI